ncbi:MAG: amino acid ABC transporter substrate-binding protein [Leadbetterella sp.]|nr:amino acid ABC transporter substrate-binding protein [Leadbetterella sp.]
MKKTLLFLLLCPGLLFAQLSDQQFLTVYKEGVSLFDEARYDEAFSKLSTLTTRNHTNGVAPYAYLYAAQAAEKKGNKYQAKILYRNLFTYYPDWDKIDEAKILYARANLEEGYYEEGLKALHEIDNTALNPLKLKVMDEYMKNVKTISALKNLYNKYPNYKPIARALVDKIQANRYNTKADLELSDMLTNRFNLLEPESSPANSTPARNSKKKDKALNFGILLPFELSSTDPAATSFRYIYDLYAGMTVAAEKLNNEGINISLHTYDIKNDAQAFKNAEKKPGFSDLNLVVGPLYPAPNTLVQKFVNDNNVVHVHPTSNNLSLLTASKNAFLMQPSHEHQAKKALDYAASTGLPKTVSVYFGEARKDSLFAQIYAAEARKRGYTVTEVRKFTGQKLSPQRGHVFLAADNNLGVRFLQSVAMSNTDAEVIMTAGSFNWDRMNTSSLTNKVALIYPEYVNREREPVKEFDKIYFEKTSGLPSYYSYLGYDIVYYFGTMLKDGQNSFNRHIERGEYIDNYLLSGYDFSEKVKQNDIVPIVKFRDNNFEEVYR